MTDRTAFAAPDDPRRVADLRRMKWRASGLLVAVTVLFVVVRVATDGDGWAGYVEAAAEAAMVGGVADWFAVTALFRHPLGIPIPHTAIIPNRKDQIGASLGTFVQENFLDGDLVAERLANFGMAERLGRWMADPKNAARIGEQTSAVIGGASEVLSDDDVANGLEQAIVGRLRALPFSPLAGRAVEVAVEGDHHQSGLDAALRGLDRMLTENRPVLRKRLGEESPGWVPEFLDDRVFEKLMSGVESLLGEVLADPQHELRHHIDVKVRELGHRLRDDPVLQARGEELKEELLDHPEVRAWFNSLWLHIKDGLIEAGDDPDSELRRRLEGAIVRAGHNLATDAALQDKVDRWIETVVRYLVDQSQGEVAELISTTVARWDAEQTGRRIEVQVGRDLQFIRINGTVVGGLIGILIHAIAQLLG